MSLASSYKNLIALEFADCENFDFKSWKASTLISAKTIKGSRDKWNKFEAYLDQITDAPVFDASTPS